MALACLSAFAFLLPSDSSDAQDASDVGKAADADWSGFSDVSAGHFYVYLNNNTSESLTVKVVVYEMDGSEEKELDSDTVTLDASETNREVKLTFSYGSSGDKTVYYKVVNEDGTFAYNLHEGGFVISVSHSIWKNTSTYVLIVVVILAIVVIAFLVVRARAKKTSATPGKTFTEMEAERKAKRAGKVAQRETYKADSSKKKKRD